MISFFYSLTFRKKTKPFIEAANRIKDLIAKQLIVCPFSPVHTDETYLWNHSEKNRLYDFIKQTAQGHKFEQSFIIKQRQLSKAFKSFIDNSQIQEQLNEKDAFSKDIHHWDKYLRIDIEPTFGNLDTLRLGKKEAVSALVDLFQGWTNLNTSFEDDFNTAMKDHSILYINQFKQLLLSINTGDIFNFFNSPKDGQLILSLLQYNSQTLSKLQRLERIKVFFKSEYFANVTNIKVSSGLFAILRKMVKNGAFKNKEKAKEKLSDLFFDFRFISVYGPYCDALFVDKSMKNICDDTQAKLFNDYSTKIFSANNWKSFHSYLDTIEENKSGELAQSLKLVYPKNFT